MGGQSITLWSDKWCGDTPLKTLFPDIYNKVAWKGVLIKECYSSQGWRWRKILKEVGVGMSRGDSKIREFKVLHIVDRTDDIRWRWNTRLSFIIKSVYTLINGGGF